MTTCEHVDEIEDLALGTLHGVARAHAEAHAASCEACGAAHAEIFAEASLFRDRTREEAPLPCLAPAVFDAHHALRRRGPSVLARITPSVVALAACVAALIGARQLHERCAPGDCDTPVFAAGAESESDVAIADEPLSCTQPVSRVVRIAQRSNSNDEALACSVSDRAMCEEPATSSPSWRVTSSVATP